jgi:CTP:molybdopterin cytidylyltransferase MocA
VAEVGVAAVVLAGGEGRRFGGDKLAASYRGSTVLDALLAELAADWLVVCVGPGRPTARSVLWTREDPPGGGPVAGVAAGVARVPADVGLVAVLAGDQPRAASAAARLVTHLTGASASIDAVVATDGTGRRNPLLSAFRRSSLLAALPASPADRAARSLFDGLVVDELPISDDEQHDIDHRSDLES